MTFFHIFKNHWIINFHLPWDVDPGSQLLCQFYFDGYAKICSNFHIKFIQNFCSNFHVKFVLKVSELLTFRYFIEIEFLAPEISLKQLFDRIIGQNARKLQTI